MALSLGFASRVAFLNSLTAKEYAELRHMATLEPLGYDRSDRDCLLTSPNQIDPSMLTFQPEQTQEDIADLILSTV